MDTQRLSNEEIVQRFYTAFQRKDGDAMAQFYSDDVLFSDPVFGKLHGTEAVSMWRMLTSQAKSLEITFTIEQAPLQASDSKITCHWIATYLFSKTNRRVVNHVTATIEISDGKIQTHHDNFDFYVWAKQAFGIAGWLVGWSKSFQLKVQTSAHLGLKKFMQKESSPELKS